jgi:DNA polymerase-4
VENLLTRYAPIVEQASIDEFYLDMTGCQKIYGSMFSFSSFIQKMIWTKLSLPCSIGIGSNKTIAKIGSDSMKPTGITYVIPGMEKQFLSPMPVETIPGVGKVMLKDLNSKGIYKIGDITELPEEYFAAAYGKYGVDLWRKANGEGTEYLTVRVKRKSISKETTFGEDVTSDEFIKKTLFELAGKICQTMRNRNWIASTISIKLRYSDFHTITRSRTIKPTDDDKVVFDTAWQMLNKNHTRRVAVRLIGVGLTNFSEYSEQEYLFEDIKIKRKKMFRAVTKIRDKFGYHAINLPSP